MEIQDGLADLSQDFSDTLGTQLPDFMSKCGIRVVLIYDVHGLLLLKDIENLYDSWM